MSHFKPHAVERSQPGPTALQALQELVLNSLHSKNSRRVYAAVLTEFFVWHLERAVGEGFSKATVQEFVVYLRLEHKLSAFHG